MNVLVIGATGATGRCLVSELLHQGSRVTVIARKASPIESLFPDSGNLTVIFGTILEMEPAALADLVKQFDAIGSCLGHNLTLRGIFGRPKYLVAESVKRLCAAVLANNRPKLMRIALMNTTGVANKDEKEKRSFGEGLLMGLLSFLLPPQKDNQKAAEFLRSQVNQNHKNIGWVIVRPDTLVNEVQVSDYAVFKSPIRSPVFNPGRTSRANVASFMASLLLNDLDWAQWRGKMPVIYNKSSVV